MTQFGWYARRLAAMSPREVMWHLRREAAARTTLTSSMRRPDRVMLTDPDQDWESLLADFRAGTGRPVLLDEDRAHFIAAKQPAEVIALLAEAERLVDGERTYFGYPAVDVGLSVDWNHDPISGHRWPAESAWRINHRSAQSDPKWIWELNRLQHLPILAQAWLFTGDDRFADTAFDHLDSWLAQNPVGTGIAWRGAFESGLRAISVAIALQGLRTSAALTPERYRDVVRMLDASARYCWYGRSLFSSANNHLIGELTGLLTVHTLFPELAAPAALSDRALERLAVEADRQILPDGAGAEQSISYQMFTAELLSLVHLLLRLSTEPGRSELGEALARSAAYLVEVVGAADPDPRYGDDDDSFALRLGSEPKRTVRQHLGIVGALLGSPDAITRGHHTLTASWTADALGTDISDMSTSTTLSVDTPTDEADFHADSGGLVVLRRDRRRITMDIGPLGYLSIAAHGHADALAITLSDDGDELIVDPGTASYYGNPSWRPVHRGTRAHATVCVDGADQSVLRGPFVWARHAVCTVRSVDLARGVVDAEHDGYRRLDDPVVHRRWLIAPPDDSTIAVVDLIQADAEHEALLSWPLHPDLDVTADGEGHTATRDGVPALRLSYAATVPAATFKISADPVAHLGWFSDRLEARTPSWLVGASFTGTGPIAILSLLRTTDTYAITDSEIVFDGTELVADWTENGVGRRLRIDTRGAGATDGNFTPSIKETVSHP